MKNKNIVVYEVGPRDGLQNQPVAVSTKDKARYIELLSQSGLSRIEVSSFVRPGAVPQLSDASALFDSFRPHEHLRYSALVPNRKGLDAALAALSKNPGKLHEIAVFSAASNSFTKKNTNATIEESLERIRELAEALRQSGHPSLKMRAYVSTVVECPYEGRISPEAVLDVSLRLLDLGAYQVSLGETIGVAVPDDIRRLLDVVCQKIGPEKLAGHFHDTRGTALANVFAALDYGLYVFDSSSAGLGGCPYAPGAAGNLATEDLVYALERSGYATGVDLDRLTEASRFILDVLDRPAASRVFLACATKQKS